MPISSHQLKKKIAELLDDDNDSFASRLFDWFIISVIVIAVISIILESEPSLHAQFTPTFLAIEYVTVTLFTIEYILRFWTAPVSRKRGHLPPRKARLGYVTSFHAIIDLLAILPLFLSFFAIDLRFLRVIRLLRIFKLTRYNSAINTLLSVIKREARAFSSVLFVLIIIVIISSSCIYLLEHEKQPEQFGSILKSMWWSIVTLSTVGYGDASPVTPLGKLFGGLIMTVGIGLVALPAGLLASAFSEQLHKNKSDYRSALKRALDDGVISPEEHRLLKKLQDKYDISNEEANELLKEQLHRKKKKEQKREYMASLEHREHHCPHCGKNFVE